MLYTIGHRETYDKYIAEETFPMKMGRTFDYAGGITFNSREEAEQSLKDNPVILDRPSTEFSVYGLDTTLENTHLACGDDGVTEHRYLINDALLLKL